MLPQLIKKRWTKLAITLGILISYLFHLLAVITLYDEGDSIFSFGKIVLPIIYVGSMWVFSRSKLLYNGLPVSTEQDGFFQRIRYDDWRAIMKEATSEDHMPLTEEDKWHIMFGPLQTDPDQVGSWRERCLIESIEKLAKTRLMNPFLTLDRVRFASWLIRELKQNPELLNSVTTRGGLIFSNEEK